MKKDLTFAFLLAALMDSISDVIYFKDKDSRFLMVNKAFLDKFGFKSQDEVISKTDFDIFTDEHARAAFEDEQRMIQSGESLDAIEEKETWPNGAETWVSSTKVPLRNELGHTVGTFGISRDITGHKEAEIREHCYLKELSKIQEEMGNDLRMAGELQKSFFPHSYPTFPQGVSDAESCVDFSYHYSPYGLVSGDFCAVTKVSDTQVGVFLCDVMGHGVRAALVTVFIYAIVQELSVKEPDPGDYLSSMNDRLLPLLRMDEMFLYATASYMVLDVVSGKARVANAGHPVPLHFSPSKGKARWLFDPDIHCGPALAIDKDASFPVLEVELDPDDSVVLYSDGAYEVANAEDKEFGPERLLEAAQRQVGSSLSETFLGLISEARAFSKEGTLDDDICFIGVHLKDLLKEK